MFQITVASSHDIKTAGIDALRAILPAEARGFLFSLFQLVQGWKWPRLLLRAQEVHPGGACEAKHIGALRRPLFKG